MKPPIDWLLEGEPWVAYRTRLDLLGETESDREVEAARAGLLKDARVKNLVDELAGWPWKVISSHKSAGQPFHKLNYLADLGLKSFDPGMDRIITPVLEHQSAEGPFQLPVDIPIHYGGSGQQSWAWALCDAPLLVYALVKMGLHSQPAVQAALQHLVGLVRANGWPCAVSPELGSFRGPGRKEDPCPFANLAMLKALSALPDNAFEAASRTGVETLLELWQESLDRHPYIFYMGTDFRKLKVPFVWYDLAHVLEVLSQFSWARDDPRLLDMLAVLEGKADQDGRFTLESAWAAWKDWEFGQKKQPSRWLTLLAWRIIGRVRTLTD